MAGVITQFFFIPSPPITEQNCPEQRSRVFIVTGGYAGVGYELSKILYAHHAVVYIAGRSEPKANDAINRIRTASPGSQGRIEFMQIDLSDLKTLRPAVNAFLAREDRLDVLVNNAAVMYPPKGSVDVQGNDLQIGTNCLGSLLLYQLLQPILRRTTALSPAATVRVAWAASVAVEVQSPKPYGMELDNDGRPANLGTQFNYGQSKVGNVFFARHFARETSETGIIHVAFNPGNLKTELQRHWQGLAPSIARILILQPAIKGAYTELYAAISPDITTEQTGAYIVPWGKIGSVRPGVETAMKSTSSSEKSIAEKFIVWCEQQTASFR